MYKDMIFILFLKQPKKLCIHIKFKKKIENQELINAVLKDAKYVKII